MLLLLNYLLVVCASAPERPVARPFDYVHHADCQLKNAWRGGTCFDDCNGVQYQVQKGHKSGAWQQLLTMLKGLDMHCLPTTADIALAPAWNRAVCWQLASPAAVPNGVRARIEAPPRRG